jgi:hypothetical protein
MHLYIATKGIKHEVDQFITELQGKYLPFKWREKKTDKFQDSHVQLSVRPIQLWEIGFPKEHYDLIANTIIGPEYHGPAGNDGKQPAEHKWFNKFIWAFRKALHLDPVPPYKKDLVLPNRKEHVAVIPLGTKQDYVMENGVEGL